MRKTGKIILGAGAGVAALSVGLAQTAFSIGVKRPKKPQTFKEEILIKRAEWRKVNNEKFFRMNPQDVSLQSVNNEQMKSWYLPAEKKTNTFVPFECGQMLYDACTVPKDFYWVKDAIHAFSYYDDKEGYEKKVKEFVSIFLDNKEYAK